MTCFYARYPSVRALHDKDNDSFVKKQKVCKKQQFGRLHQQLMLS